MSVPLTLFGLLERGPSHATSVATAIEPDASTISTLTGAKL
jgi:hypothetical protein